MADLIKIKDVYGYPDLCMTEEQWGALKIGDVVYRVSDNMEPVPFKLHSENDGIRYFELPDRGSLWTAGVYNRDLYYPTRVNALSACVQELTKELKVSEAAYHAIQSKLLTTKQRIEKLLLEEREREN